MLSSTNSLLSAEDMNSGPELSKLESLLSYCRQNNRVCPQPKYWNEFWAQLPGRTQSTHRWTPAPPLILAAWPHASDAEKMQRLSEHIAWAATHDALDE